MIVCTRNDLHPLLSTFIKILDTKNMKIDLRKNYSSKNGKNFHEKMYKNSH